MRTSRGINVWRLRWIPILLLAAFICLTAFAGKAYAATESGASYGTASLSKDGKVQLTLSIDKTALQENLRGKDAFTSYVHEIVKSVNSSSKDTDMVTLKKIKDDGDYYAVQVSTRRINSNMKGMGDFAWSKLGTFTMPESDTYTRLALMANGNLRCQLAKPFCDVSGYVLSGYVEIEAGTKKNQVYIKPVDAETNKELTVDEFSAAGQNASDKTHISMFRIPDVKSIAKITVKLPGKVKYVSSECVKVVDENTIEMTPVKIIANVVRNEYVLDENGNLIYDTSGVASVVPIIEKDKQIDCIFGYVAYEHGPNWWLIGILSALGAGLLVFIILGFAKGWFAKFFGIERKAKKEKTSESAKGLMPNTVSGSFSSGGTGGAGAATVVRFSSASASGGGAVAVANATQIDEVRKQEKLRRKNLRAKSMFAKIAKHKLLYLMLLPSLILVIMFCYVPMFGVVIAFKDYNLIDGFMGSEWVGLKYFKYIFMGSDPKIFLVFRNTLYISLIRVATNFPAILIFALMINEIKSGKLKGLARTISYLPNFISWIAVGGMMVALFSVDEGMLNSILTKLSGHTVKINWYGENKYWWMILALSSMWKSLGWGTIIYMSALGCINSELYDACRIDGGGRFRMILSVTIPGIMNVIMLQLIMDAANLIRDNYEQILAMTRGSQDLSESTYVVGAMVYSSVMGGSGFSQATAFSLVQGVIGLVLVLLTNKVAKKTDNEGVI